MVKEIAGLQSSREVMELTADQNLFSGKFAQARRLYNKLLSSPGSQNDFLFQGRILRKIGNSYNQQWRFKEAEVFYENAEQALLKVRESKIVRSEWIELQIDYCYVIMHLRKIALYEEKKEKLKSLIELQGTILQKARYSYIIFNDLLWKNGWYMLPDETVIVCERMIAIAQSENNLPIKLTVQNMLGFTHLFRHEFLKARTVAFEILDNINREEYGEEMIRAYCTLCFSYRKEKNVEKTKEWTTKAYKVADFNKNTTVRYLMDSISAWLQLKDGDLAKATDLAKESYNGMTKYRYPFLAFSLLPLIAIYTRQNKIHMAVQCAFRLFAPNQQKIPDDIGMHLKKAIACWGKDDIATAKLALNEAVQQADEMGIL